MSELKIIDKSICTCNKGVAPGILSVTSQRIVKTNGKLQATEGDKTITPFGVCAITRTPCSMALVQWQKTAKGVKVNGLKYLTEKSKIQCSIGGEISFAKPSQNIVKCGGSSPSEQSIHSNSFSAVSPSVTNGISSTTTAVMQDAIAKSTEAEATSNAKITDIQWHDGTSNHVITKASYGDSVYLSAQVVNPVGSMATISITKKDGGKLSRFKTQLTYTATLDAEGFLKIDPFEIKVDWEAFKKTDIDKLVATITHDGVSKDSNLLTLVTKKGINISRLSSKDQTTYNKKIAELRAKNIYFDFYYTKLDHSEHTYYVTKINSSKGGSFYPKSRKIIVSGTDTTYYEEFFHAYQSEFYGQNSMLPTKGTDIIGAVNKETEAELLTFLFNNDISIGNSMGGSAKNGSWDLTNFALDIFGNKRGFIEIKPVILNEDEQKQYLEAVKAIKEANMDGSTAVYKSTMTQELPNALLYIIKNAYKNEK